MDEESISHGHITAFSHWLIEISLVSKLCFIRLIKVSLKTCELQVVVVRLLFGVISFYLRH